MKGVSLFDICSPKQWPTIASRDLAESGYPVYGANGKIGYYERYNHEHPTILITCRGATCGTINISDPFSYVNGNAMALDDLDSTRADLNYVARYLQHRGLRDVISGSAQPQITREGLRNLTVPLPSLVEQRRIAAILNKADALRAKRREAIAKLDQLLQSVFLDMFGDPVTNPMRWPIFKAERLFAEKPRLGTTQPATGRGTIVVRVGEVGAARIRFAQCSRAELDDTSIQRFRLSQGDTILARAIGSQTQLGKCSYFDGHIEPVCIDSHVMRLRPNADLMNPIWFYHLLSGDAGKAMLQAKGGATAVQFNINSSQAADLDIALPPMALQTKFELLVGQATAALTRQSESLTKITALSSALQHQAFGG